MAAFDLGKRDNMMVSFRLFKGHRTRFALWSSKGKPEDTSNTWESLVLSHNRKRFLESAHDPETCMAQNSARHWRADCINLPIHRETPGPCTHVCVPSRFSLVWLFVTLWIVACPALLSMEFSKQGYWSGLPCPPPGDGILQARILRILEWVTMPSWRGSSRPRDRTLTSCVSCIGKQVLYH